MSDHIVHWMLDKPLLSKVAHPSNIFRPALVGVAYGSDAADAFELDRIFGKRPTIVVIDEFWSVTFGSVERKARIKSFLASYVLAFCSGRLNVFIEAERVVEPGGTCRKPPSEVGSVPRLGGNSG